MTLLRSMRCYVYSKVKAVWPWTLSMQTGSGIILNHVPGSGSIKIILFVANVLFLKILHALSRVKWSCTQNVALLPINFIRNDYTLSQKFSAYSVVCILIISFCTRIYFQRLHEDKISA